MSEMNPASVGAMSNLIGPTVGFQLTAQTEAGRKFVTLAEKHATDFAQRAGQHDSQGNFPFENFKEMQQSSFLAAAVPQEYGGLGVTSLYDLMVGMSRLARGDASTAIAVNMHIAAVLDGAQVWRRGKAEGDQQIVDRWADLLSQVGAGSTLMCSPLSELGADHESPETEANPSGDGYLINGRKTFGTGSPAAQLFLPRVRLPKEGGRYLTATAIIPRETPGLAIEDNWDSLGMRASGSNDVTFTNCFIPSSQLIGVRDDYGVIGPGYISAALLVNLPLAAIFLGIAEAAKAHALDAAAQRKGQHKRRLADRASIQNLMAEIEVDLFTCRAALERAGQRMDGFVTDYENGCPDFSTVDSLVVESQIAKCLVNRKAIEVVDRAMAICGGGAYMNRHPLAQLYRDVRYGPFMQPFSPHEALEYIGKVSLGLDPVMDR